MNIVGHILGEIAAAVISSPAFNAGADLGRYVVSLLP